MKIKRPSWDDYFMMLAEVVKKRADCTRRQVGAIIIKDKRIIATGYNGTPHKIKNCTDGGCSRCKKRDKKEMKKIDVADALV